MSKHSPGPWHTCPQDSRPEEFWVRCVNSQGQIESVAKVVKPFSMDRDEYMANVNLIKAAPKLLAACKQAVALLDASDNDQREAHQAMLEAIEEAEA